MNIKSNALLAIAAASDQRELAGYFVGPTGAVVNSASAVPFGVILDGGNTGEVTTIGLMSGFSGIVTVKVGAATGAITAGTRLQLNADGSVRASIGTGRDVAVAIEAGVAEERIAAVLIQPQSLTPFVMVSALGGALLAIHSGGFISNLGAAGATTFTLPPATPGLNFTFIVEAAQELRIDPDGNETIALPSSGVQSAAGKYIGADAVGEKVKIVCLTAGTWSVEHYSGTWTAQS